MSRFFIEVECGSNDPLQQLEIIECVQDIVKNLTVENLKLLAKKSKTPNINKKIQTYKHLM